MDAWLVCAGKASTLASLLDCFELSLNALCLRTNDALGEITLAAITMRVVHNGARKYPLFGALSIASTGAIECTALRERIAARAGTTEAWEANDMLQGIRHVLVEFLTVVGNLTAEILTPALHAALSSAVPSNEVHAT